MNDYVTLICTLVSGKSTRRDRRKRPPFVTTTARQLCLDKENQNIACINDLFAMRTHVMCAFQRNSSFRKMEFNFQYLPYSHDDEEVNWLFLAKWLSKFNIFAGNISALKIKQQQQTIISFRESPSMWICRRLDILSCLINLFRWPNTMRWISYHRHRWWYLTPNIVSRCVSEKKIRCSW